MRTDDPIQRLLSTWQILEMQWNLQRVAEIDNMALDDSRHDDGDCSSMEHVCSLWQGKHWANGLRTTRQFQEACADSFLSKALTLIANPQQRPGQVKATRQASIIEVHNTCLFHIIGNSLESSCVFHIISFTTPASHWFRNGNRHSCRNKHNPPGSNQRGIH